MLPDDPLAIGGFAHAHQLSWAVMRTPVYAALTGAWWICILAIPLGVYLSHGFDRRGGKWRLIHAANQANDTSSSASKTKTPP